MSTIVAHKQPLTQQHEAYPHFEEIRDWLVSEGLRGARRIEIISGLGKKLVEAGIPLFRIHLAQKALHPRFGSIGVTWYRDGETDREGYERTEETTETWARSPLFYMLNERKTELRLDPTDRETAERFSFIAGMAERGATDYLAMAMAFKQADETQSSNPNDPPEGVLLSWISDGPNGFSQTDINCIRKLLPALCLVLKAASDRRMATDLLETYLGKDAGRRVLSGEIKRGSLQSMHAAVLIFDLRGYTRLSGSLPGETMISMLNDYYAAVVPVIEGHGGNVLKFMGDGLLAIFDHPDRDRACCSAISAATSICAAMQEANRQREAEGKPVTSHRLALHAGEVLYGNIGSQDRLDFTVIGPTVNETERLLTMAKSLEQTTVISSEVARPALGERDDLVSLGRYMLRGVAEPEDLYTIYGKAGECAAKD